MKHHDLVVKGRRVVKELSDAIDKLEADDIPAFQAARSSASQLYDDWDDYVAAESL